MIGRRWGIGIGFVMGVILLLVLCGCDKDKKPTIAYTENILLMARDAKTKAETRAVQVKEPEGFTLVSYTEEMQAELGVCSHELTKDDLNFRYQVVDQAYYDYQVEMWKGRTTQIPEYYEGLTETVRNGDGEEIGRITEEIKAHGFVYERRFEYFKPLPDGNYLDILVYPTPGVADPKVEARDDVDGDTYLALTCDCYYLIQESQTEEAR